MLLNFFKGFRGLIETAEYTSVVSLKPWKSVPRSQWNRWIRFSSLIETAEAASTASLKSQNQAISREYLEFLREFEAICEMALAREYQGPRVGWFMKKLRVENLVTLSL
jgi:hypothetical protein